MRLPVRISDIVDISVRNPRKVLSDQEYTTFEISVKTSHIAFSLPHSATRRRYSDFTWLRKKLRDHHPKIKPPQLPRKAFFSSQRFDPEFVAVRMKALEEFLLKCFEERLYFSDTSLHLFVQTNLSCVQIDQYLRGSITQDVVDTALHTCRRNDCIELETSEETSLVSLVTVGEGSSKRDELCINESSRGTSTPVTSCATNSPLPAGLLDLSKFSDDSGLGRTSPSSSLSDLGDSDFVPCAVGPGNIQ